MTARQIAQACAILLQADDIEETLDAAEADAEISALDGDCRTLFKCVDLAAGEILGDGFPVIFKATATAAEGRIELESLHAATVIRVERLGMPVHFTVDGSGLAVRSDGEHTITYTRARENIASVDGGISLGVGASDDMLVYLSARNYCLVTGRTDEASVWDQRYAAEAEKRRIVRRARLPRRAWR